MIKNLPPLSEYLYLQLNTTLIGIEFQVQKT